MASLKSPLIPLALPLIRFLSRAVLEAVAVGLLSSAAGLMCHVALLYTDLLVAYSPSAAREAEATENIKARALSILLSRSPLSVCKNLTLISLLGYLVVELGIGSLFYSRH